MGRMCVRLGPLVNHPDKYKEHGEDNKPVFELRVEWRYDQFSFFIEILRSSYSFYLEVIYCL